MRASRIVVCAFWVGVASAVAWADDDQAIVAFGQGVHAYFDGQYDVADKLLSEAIEADTTDPRPYFFRGLVHQLRGQPQLANVDFQKGAEVEMSFVGRSFDVDDMLERIQGPIRIEIEKYRHEAVARAKELRRRSNLAVDQDDPAAGLGTPLDPRTLPDVSQIVDATIPFPEISAKPYYPPAKSAADIQSAAQRADAAAKTAADMPQGVPPKAADDPFNTGGNKPVDSKPMKDAAEGQNPPPAADDPFGSDSKGNDTGDSESNKDGKENPEPKPGEGDQPESTDDPFGGG